MLQLKTYSTGLDGGCVYGGKLAACVIPIGKLLKEYSKNKGQHNNTFEPTHRNLEMKIIVTEGWKGTPEF